LIWDDQAMVREGFAALLSASRTSWFLGDAANGADGVGADPAGSTPTSC